MLAVVAMTLFLPLAQAAAEQPLDPALVPFVPSGEAAFVVESADLNGDGTLDFLLVTGAIAHGNW